MNTIRIGIVLSVVAATLCGCTNPYQHQVDQSLLLQENQRLEEALYVTHAQLVELKRENEALKTQPTAGGGSGSTSTVRPKRAEFAPRDDYDEAPSFEPPQVEIPKNAPESSTLPDSMKSSRIAPPKSKPDEPVFPELTLPQQNVGELVPPTWSPTR